MKTKALVVVVAVSAGLALSGCDQIKKLVGGGKPTGQVVATVDGEEITTLQLRAELGNFSSRDPAVMKAAQQQALQRIILRKMLAEEARKMKLDKGADYTLQLERGQETLLAQLYQRKLASQTTQPTRAEAEAFVQSHPEMFANRRVMFVDQVIAAPTKIAPERLRPLKTLDEVKALLAAEGVQYQENAVVLDTLTGNPALVKAVINLPAGEVFVIPQGGSLLFNQVTAVRPTPFVGDMATAFAMNTIRGQKAQTFVAKKVTDMRKGAESKIIYNPAYKPPPPKKKAAAPAPATAAPAAAPAEAPAAPPAEPAAK
ncbi:peptidyl-prolyl cis-trans isomerase [Phenylobacterium sp.]|uniref:peptidyl-prolyl cis-trans isomerase n=1 Tax=Phenylobacterium sp. TaxID=1871053 RepID=UPI002EDB17B7